MSALGRKRTLSSSLPCGASLTKNSGTPGIGESSAVLSERAMYLVEAQKLDEVAARRRRTPRLNVQCRARILIGNRHYAGYLLNISPAGAKLRTVTLIRRVGRVVLTLPDLPPMHCHLRWNDGYNAGVEFAQPLPHRQFRIWADARSEACGRANLLPAATAYLAEAAAHQPEPDC